MVPYKERDLRAAPQFLTPLVDRSVVAGYTVTLNCAVRGHPKVWGRCGVSMGWVGGMGSLWGLYGVSMGLYGVPIGPYGVPMGLYGPLWGSIGP